MANEFLALSALLDIILPFIEVVLPVLILYPLSPAKIPAWSVTVLSLLSIRPTLPPTLPIVPLNLGDVETEKPAALLCSLKLSILCKLSILRLLPVFTVTPLPLILDPIISVLRFALICANSTARIDVGL